jgi:hypothetical protein
VLHKELEGWRLQETRKVKGAGLPADKEHAALRLLLQKETKLLQTIDRCAAGARAGRVRCRSRFMHACRPSDGSALHSGDLGRLGPIGRWTRGQG